MPHDDDDLTDDAAIHCAESHIACAIALIYPRWDAGQALAMVTQMLQEQTALARVTHLLHAESPSPAVH